MITHTSVFLFCFACSVACLLLLIFFFNDTATTEIYTYLHTLSLHYALPICFVGVFNRSHYEDVVEAGVQNWVPESVRMKRINQIRQFEIMLAENNVKILKFYLHIRSEEHPSELQSLMRI